MEQKVFLIFIGLFGLILLLVLLGGSTKRYDGPLDPAPAGFEGDVAKLTNSTRASRGLNQLQYDESLSKVARDHSEDMIRRNFFSHTNPSGESPAQRARRANYPYQYIGENIAQGYPQPQTVFDGWMKSSGHRANILRNGYQRIGVGVARGNGTIMWTQMFS